MFERTTPGAAEKKSSLRAKDGEISKAWALLKASLPLAMSKRRAITAARINF